MNPPFRVQRCNRELIQRCLAFRSAPLTVKNVTFKILHISKQAKKHFERTPE